MRSETRPEVQAFEAQAVIARALWPDELPTSTAWEVIAQRVDLGLDELAEGATISAWGIDVTAICVNR